jgi:hypothetical protein
VDRRSDNATSVDVEIDPHCRRKNVLREKRFSLGERFSHELGCFPEIDFAPSSVDASTGQPKPPRGPTQEEGPGLHVGRLRWASGRPSSAASDASGLRPSPSAHTHLACHDRPKVIVECLQGYCPVRHRLRGGFREPEQPRQGRFGEANVMQSWQSTVRMILCDILPNAKTASLSPKHFRCCTFPSGSSCSCCSS